MTSPDSQKEALRRDVFAEVWDAFKGRGSQTDSLDSQAHRLADKIMAHVQYHAQPPSTVAEVRVGADEIYNGNMKTDSYIITSRAAFTNAQPALTEDEAVEIMKKSYANATTGKYAYYHENGLRAVYRAFVAAGVIPAPISTKETVCRHPHYAQAALESGDIECVICKETV